MNYQEWLFSEGVLPLHNKDMERAMLDYLNQHFTTVDNHETEIEIYNRAIAFIAGYIAALDRAMAETERVFGNLK